MTWNSKYASEQYFAVNINGNAVQLPVSQIAELIKKKLKSSPTVLSMLEEYDMHSDRLDDLVIEIVPLDKKYAETDANSIRLNTFLFENHDFFEEYFFVVPHELVHWLSRKKEEEAYFNDPEEVLGFVASVAYEMENGTEQDIIWNKIYNKISWHFSNENDAREFFVNMMERAKELVTKGQRNIAK